VKTIEDSWICKSIDRGFNVLLDTFDNIHRPGPGRSPSRDDR
jgi:hypothetical protein